MGQGFHYFWVCHGVGFSNTKIEEFLAWVGGKSGTLGALDSLELVNRGFFEAVSGSPNSLGEEVVKVGRHFVCSLRHEGYDKTRRNAKGVVWMETTRSNHRFRSYDGGFA